VPLFDQTKDVFRETGCRLVPLGISWFISNDSDANRVLLDGEQTRPYNTRLMKEMGRKRKTKLLTGNIGS
jgi:hypothetical protein